MKKTKDEAKDDNYKRRTDDFDWFSKQELYKHFQGMYDVDEPTINREIDKALKSFTLRKGRPINTQELWQKVGKSIEKRLCKADDPTALYKIDKKLIEKYGKKKNIE